MITIDRITDEKGRRYHFPTIDFKFQNRGRATAFLWQFAIEVIHAEIDQTPLLDFRSDVQSGVLLIQVTNNGWGDAQNCHVQLREPILNDLFSDSALQYRGTLQSGKIQDIFHLSTVAADPQQLQIVKRRFKDLSSDPYRQRQNLHHAQAPGLTLGAIQVNWHCEGSQYRGNTQVYQTFRGETILTEFGFERFVRPPNVGAAAPSDITYAAIIDPSQGSFIQKYPISRKILPGDIERFHVMVGSPMSCDMQIRFKFFVDERSVIESEIFNVNIWNPRNSHWHYEYTDDKDKLRQSYYHRKEMESDSSIFPLTADKKL